MPSQPLERQVGTTMPEFRPRDAAAILEQCQDVLRYRFENATYLKEALTHASGADHRLASNERLEFLGDSILGAIVCELLFLKYPDYLEGELTRVKSVVVSRRTCAKISRALALDDFLVLGKGMGSHDETPSSVLADVFESLIGAIYLDGGMEAAKQFIVRHIDAEIDETVDGHGGINRSERFSERSLGLAGWVEYHGATRDRRGRSGGTSCTRPTLRIQAGTPTGPSHRESRPTLSGSLVADLGIGPEVWLFLSLI